MATTATTRRAEQAGRYFYSAMAFIFLAAAIIGFTPNSAAILSGAHANPPLLIHVHAAVMVSWLALLCCQATLIPAGRFDIHQRLGQLSLILAPAVILLMVLIVIRDLREGPLPAAVAIIQAKRIAVFGVCVALALVLRKSQSDAHKRLMFLATFAVLDAAFFRMDWFLPSFGFDNFATIGHLWQLVLLVPFLVNDLVTTGRVHPVFMIGIPVIIGLQGFAAVLW